MAGLPGISIPCGLSEGLPVGLQLIGAAWSEPALFRLRARLRGDHRDAAVAADRARRPGRGSTIPATPTPAERVAAARPSRAATVPADDRPRRHRPVRPLAERALAERVRAVPPSGIRRFFDILATMDDVISLGVGEPDFDTPRADRRGRRRAPARRPDALHVATTARSSCGARSPTHLERRYGVGYDPATELLVTVGASEAVDLALRATCDPGDEVILHEPSYVAYVPADRLRRRRRRATSRPASRTTSPSTRRRSRRRSRRGRRRCSSAIRATRPAPSCPTTSRTSSRRIADAPRPARLQRRDLRPARLRHVPPPRVQRAAGDARADDPDGRLLEGLRDDRLAGRLRVRRRRRSSRGSSRSTSTGSCRRRRRPRTRRWRRSSRASRTSSGCVAEYDRRRRLVVDGLNALGPRDVRAARRVLRLPADHARPA